jgi:electron transfer flavoprotein alpha subunit
MMSEAMNMVVMGREAGGEVTAATRELLYRARNLAGEGRGRVILLLLGLEAGQAAEHAVKLGADLVLTAEGLPAGETNPELVAVLLEAACQREKPDVVMLAHDDIGRDAGPRLAARLAAAAALDCVDIALDDKGGLVVTRPVFGGRAAAVWSCPPGSVLVVTMKPRSCPASEADESRRGEVAALDASAHAGAVKTRIVESGREEVTGPKLEDARVVVSGGGGIGGGEGFSMLQELAGLLGGAVGASRVPCDEGWAPKSMEIGQTGRVVGPDLYIAVGISGAPQHLAGCAEAKKIVAINKDAEAPIFRAADFGVVADYRQAIPALIEKLKTLLA